MYKSNQNSVILTCLCFLSPLYNMENQIIRLVGLGIMLFLLFWMYFSCFPVIKTKKNEFLLFVIMLTLLSVATVKNLSTYAIRSLLLITLSFASLYYFSHIDIQKINYTLIRRLILIQNLVILAPLLVGKGIAANGMGYKGIFSKTTFLGIYASIMLEICIACAIYTKQKLLWIIPIILELVIIYLARVRTAEIGMILLLLFLLFYPRIKKIKIRSFKAINIIWILLLVGAVFAYINMSKLPNIQEIQDLVYKYTHKILLSGREVIWRNAIEGMKDSFLFGVGLDASLAFSETSFHNSYVDLYVSGGIITLIIFVIYLVYNLNKSHPQDSKIQYYLYVCTLVNLFISSGEVMLIRGQSVLQLFVWMIFGLSINRSFSDCKAVNAGDSP